MTMYGFISMINHGKPNILHSTIPPYLNMWYASKDIQPDEQIFIDYIETISNQTTRK